MLGALSGHPGVDLVAGRTFGMVGLVVWLFLAACWDAEVGAFIALLLGSFGWALLVAQLMVGQPAVAQHLVYLLATLLAGWLVRDKEPGFPLLLLVAVPLGTGMVAVLLLWASGGLAAWGHVMQVTVVLTLLALTLKAVRGKSRKHPGHKEQQTVHKPLT